VILHTRAGRCAGLKWQECHALRSSSHTQLQRCQIYWHISTQRMNSSCIHIKQAPLERHVEKEMHTADPVESRTVMYQGTSLMAPMSQFILAQTICNNKTSCHVNPKHSTGIIAQQACRLEFIPIRCAAALP
jgi:hypothetical protein